MTIAILSWGAEKTLYNTLESYAYHGLDKQDSDRLVLLQEGTNQQRAWVSAMGWRTIVTPFNVGIAEGYRLLVKEAKGDTFLFLENDWELLRPPATDLGMGRILLDEGVDIIRLRDRHNPGSPLWTRQFEGREYDRPTHLLDSIHWTDPGKFPEVQTWRREYYEINSFDPLSPFAEKKTAEWFITSSKYANWTNNPHMAYTSFLKENILPRLKGGNLESDIQGWWEQQDFKVAQSEGLFTHKRLD